MFLRDYLEFCKEDYPDNKTEVAVISEKSAFQLLQIQISCAKHLR